MAYYSPPPGYMPYDHRTPPMSPGPEYYSARYGPNPMATPRMGSAKVHGHARRASHAVPPQYAASSNPAGRPPMPSHTTFNSSRYQTPRATPEYDYVSRAFDSGHGHGYGYGYGYVRPARPRRDTDAAFKRASREKKRRPSDYSMRYVHTVYDGYGYACDDAADDVYGHPPPPYQPHQSYQPYAYHERDADHYCYDQVPIYEPEPKTSARPRRASHSTRGPQQPSAAPKRPSPKPAAKATAEDASRAGIPAGYSYKNWDPTEEPIMLLGSVFDANSLGKWIYDWTVFHYGPATPIAEMAGELWLLLIQLAAKVKRAEENMDKIRRKENAEMVEDFLESGERLWIRFAKLLKVCEDYMWKAAKKESGEKKPIAMGKNSGREFVESIFGRDRELERTEKLMTGMRLWSMRFDANCEAILRHPSA